LSKAHGGVEVAEVRVRESSVHGSGHASTADRLVLDLLYAPGRDAGLPDSMLLKTFLEHPHAPRVMYRTEARFYREIRPELSIETPAYYGFLYDERDRRSGILMEDLSSRAAEFPDATGTVSMENVRALLATLAELHAQFWATPRFAGDLDWVPTPQAGGMHDVFEEIGLALVRDQLSIPFKAELMKPLGLSPERLWEGLWKVQKLLDAEPRTLLHGDTHIGNTYLLPGGGAGLVDWQLMIKAVWAHDATYLIITSLPVEARRAHEKDLLAFYRDELSRNGVVAPSADEAWHLYRCAAVWGLVIGWLITPPQNYGEEITAENILRLVTAVRDLESFRALG
jgi:aminoglycoside phosphotransferase (APT) family kinase protein